MYKQFTMELAGRTLRVDIGRVAAQRRCIYAIWRHGRIVHGYGIGQAQGRD